MNAGDAYLLTKYYKKHFDKQYIKDTESKIMAAVLKGEFSAVVDYIPGEYVWELKERGYDVKTWPKSGGLYVVYWM